MNYDYVVVGGGASGCALAARLAAACSGARVALLEAGPKRRNPVFSIPALGAFAPFLSGTNWSHATQPNPALDGRTPALFQGRMLGGSGAINGMVVTRGHRANYDAWRDAGCMGWGYDDLLPYFRRFESNWRGAGPLHGADGPIRIRRAVPPTELASLFLDAAAQAGFEIADDLNANGADMFGLTDVNIADGRRCAAHTAYLGACPPANLDILTGHRVLDLTIEGSKVRGVRVARADGVATVRAAREVVLCAGAIKTAQILLVSGIGPAAELRALGISVVADSPEVGANLQNHPSLPLRYAIDRPISLKRFAAFGPAIAAAIGYAARKSGVLAENFFPVAGFIRTATNLPAPDAQIVMSPVLMPRLPAPLPKMLPHAHGMTLFVQQGTPYSRGRVRLTSADPSASPSIETGAFADPRDIDVTVAAVRHAARIMAQPALGGLAGGCEVDLSNAESIRAAIRANAGTAYHQCGTCRMGGTDGVVDTALRVRGVSGLRVVDGSIIPLIPNAALHAPTLMIAERAAAIIAAA